MLMYRYDGAGTELLATGSSDGTVKLWEGSNGVLRATLRGGSSNSIICCDLSNGVIVAAGTDKTCRVWNIRTERMVRLRQAQNIRKYCLVWASYEGTKTRFSRAFNLFSLQDAPLGRTRA